MNSELDEEFIALFTKLPERVKHTARKNYRLWKEDPGHPGLEFKAVAGVDNVYSVCVGIGWRDLGVLRAEIIPSSGFGLARTRSMTSC